jgi:hypothetical protein
LGLLLHLPLKRMAIGLCGGLLIFGAMALHSSFPALFTRGSDFTFSISDILGGQWRHLIGNSTAVIKWFGIYLTWPVVGLLLSSFLLKKKSLVFVVAGLLFVAPFIILGKVIASRYLLPVLVFFLPAAAIQLETVWRKSPWAMFMLTCLIGVQAVWFDSFVLLQPERIPFPHEDEVQYLTEWSSGYGIPEVRDFIIEAAEKERVVVGTEGYFGTLPDGLLMYFINHPALAQVEIFGVGQPIGSIPPILLEKAKTDTTYLLVNSHRFFIDPLPANLQLVAAYPRPKNGPSLLLLRVLPSKERPE